jgi:hypothetical protein
MKTKSLTVAASLAAVLTAVEVNACQLYVTVICPTSDKTAAGIMVCATSSDKSSTTCVPTDATGLAHLDLPQPDTYTICVDPTTLPPGATINNGHLCQKQYVPDVGPGVDAEFDLSGNFCTGTPSGFCWMTGGGNIGKGGQPDFSYGGVVYPGCSATAAGGGNWNVIDHNTGLHLSAENITVTQCSGPGTSSPKVNVRIIDFTGTGEIAGGPSGLVNVSFVGRAIDNHDGGAGSDQLYLLVVDSSNNVLMQIGSTAQSPATVSTGNIQIHQTSCGK